MIRRPKGKGDEKEKQEVEVATKGADAEVRYEPTPA